MGIYTLPRSSCTVLKLNKKVTLDYDDIIMKLSYFPSKSIIIEYTKGNDFNAEKIVEFLLDLDYVVLGCYEVKET